jgi:hypothetical protein
MSTHSMHESTVPAHTPAAGLTGSAWRGVLIGLVPLGLLIVMVAATLLLTVLARQLAANAGFAVQQSAAVITLITGLLLAIAAFAVATWRVLRRVAIWQQGGAIVQARATLWALGVTGLVVIGPVLLALLLPQHPFP